MDEHNLFDLKELKLKTKSSKTCALYGASVGGPVGAAIGSAVGAAFGTAYQELHKDKPKS